MTRLDLPFLRAVLAASFVACWGCGGGGQGPGDMGSDATADMAADASNDVASDAPASCPNVFGDYDVAITAGTGCGNLDENASQSIEGTAVACFAHFVSTGGSPAVNGGDMIDENGDFSSANLIFGMGAGSARSGCSGTWNDASGVMVLSCGAGPDLCEVTLTRL